MRQLWVWFVLAFVAIFRKQFWRIGSLLFINVDRTLKQNNNTVHTGLTFEERTETPAFTVCHTIEDGIERVVYTPKDQRHQTPILMLHGMWHGAWCWKWWQELLAEWGWESCAFSLPGHGRSVEQRPIPLCTLDYYLSFLKSEIERLDRLPVLMGHSMGGAITQWYLRYVRDDLPAVVLIASWVSHAAMVDGLVQFLKVDPVGILLTGFSGDASPYIRTPQHAAEKLISRDALLSPEELRASLVNESALVLLQHNPPLWHPKEAVRAPILYADGEKDRVLSLNAARQTADHYRADFLVAENAAHNLMMEHNYRDTLARIHEWLEQQNID